MARGVCLGIWLICLVQAEHVSRLWAPQGSSSQRQNGDAYVGFSHQDGRLRRLEGGYPQNQFRQAYVSPRSAHGGGLNPPSAVKSHAQTLRPVQSPLRPLRSSLFAKADQQQQQQATSNNKEAEAQKVPKKKFQLSSAVVSGGSVSRRGHQKNDPAGNAKKGSQPGTRPALGPRDSYSFRPAAAPAAGPPSYYGQKSERSSTLFGASGLVQTRTSASSPGRKVSRNKPKPWSSAFPPQVVSRHIAFGQTGFKPPKQDPTRAAGGQRESGANRRFAPTRTFDIPERFGGFAIKRLKSPEEEKKKPAAVLKPQWGPVAPKPQVQHFKPGAKWTPLAPPQSAARELQRVPQDTQWTRVRLQQGRR